jgi:hypothetical protein
MSVASSSLAGTRRRRDLLTGSVVCNSNLIESVVCSLILRPHPLLFCQLLPPLHPISHNKQNNHEQYHIHQSQKRKGPTRIHSVAHRNNRRTAPRVSSLYTYPPYKYCYSPPTRAHQAPRKINRRCRCSRLITMQINQQPIRHIERRANSKSNHKQRYLWPSDVRLKFD